MIINQNEPMKMHTSLKVGGVAKYFIKVESINDLIEAIKFTQNQNIPYFILGNGTNVLVSDNGYNGSIITLSKEFNEIETINENEFKVYAAIPLSRFARFTLKRGLRGMHKLAGIPGTVGGAIFMNAGAYGEETSECLKTVTSLNKNGNILVRKKDECKFDYRQSIYQKENSEIILNATFELHTKESITVLENELLDCLKKRKATQPLNMPNAGSTFKRLNYLSKDNAQVAPGYYIEQANLKGFSIGGAQISNVHANFIVNTKDATASDVYKLICYIQNKVYEKFGLKLEREIILLGDF